MAFEGQMPLTLGNFLSGDDLSTKQYHFMKFSSGTIIACDAVGDDIIGVLQNNPTSGRACTVCVIGETKIVAGSTGLLLGSHIKTSTGGRALVAVTGTTGTSVAGFAVGKVTHLEATATGEMAVAIINCVTPRSVQTT